jgi:NADH-quinone oxidoreductase subunit C
VPDATGLELVAQEVRAHFGDESVVHTSFAHGEATIQVAPALVADVVEFLSFAAGEPYDALMSVHGCDYLPEEPRLGVHYQLLSTVRAERLGVKTRVTVEEAEVPSVTPLFPTAGFQEREIFDFFGVVFTGHPDLRRLHMPEDYEGHPQRRDFPIGGEPVLFTFNEQRLPRWYE